MGAKGAAALHDEESLAKLNRHALQRVAKKQRVNAGGKSSEIIARILTKIAADNEDKDELPAENQPKIPAGNKVEIQSPAKSPNSALASIGGSRLTTSIAVLISYLYNRFVRLAAKPNSHEFAENTYDSPQKACESPDNQQAKSDKTANADAGNNTKGSRRIPSGRKQASSLTVHL
eukprot:scaffold293682_cov39-Prasinocladus_malaysianus.AAC.1